MPKAQLPTTLKGWAIAGVASGVGFIAGFVALDLLTRSKWAK